LNKRGWWNTLVWILRKLHLAVLVYVLIGWALPGAFLGIYLWFIPIMILQWLFNKGTCILTNLENALTENTAPKNAQQGQFLKSLFQKLTGVVPSDRLLFVGIYILLAVFWVIALLRCMYL